MQSIIHNSKNLIESVSTDFGQVFYAQPKGCASPKNITELVTVVKDCFDTNTPIIPRGMSHSASGQCLSNNGVVINMKKLNAIHNIEFNGESGTVKVDAGITWEKLIKACLEHNAAPPVLTDWQKLTVGGTVSTGGLGFMSHATGIQADIVEELEVVTGEGKLLKCSLTENKDLFKLVRGGLGQYGIIATLKIKLKKAPKVMHVHKALITDTLELSDVMNSIRGRDQFECIHSFLIPHQTHEFVKKFGVEGYEKHKVRFDEISTKNAFSYFIEVVQYEYENEAFSPEPFIKNEFSYYEKTNFFDYVTKEPPLITTQKEKGKTAHPELAVFIPVRQFTSFMTHFLKSHKVEHMGDGPVLIMPISSKSIDETAFVPIEEDFYFIGVLRNAFPNTKENITYLTSLNEELYRHALTLGGKRYPCDSLIFPKTNKEWKAHFGDKWDFVSEGKKTFDPKHIFKSLLTIHQNDI